MKNFKKTTQNIIFFFLMLVGIKNLFFSLPLRSMQLFADFYVNKIYPHEIMLHHTLSFLLGLLMLIFAHKLYKRVRLAWVVEVLSLTMSIVVQLWIYHRFTIPTVIIEVFILVSLCITHKDFSRRSNPVTVKKAFCFILFSVALILINSTVGIYLMRGSFRNIHDIIDALLRSVNLLIFMDIHVMQTSGKIAELYSFMLMTINWICIFAAVILLLKPLIYTTTVTKHDRKKVRPLLNLYGQNPLSYLALEHDKQYFFDSRREGCCAYTLVGDVFVVCGDPICNPDEIDIFLTELLEFCKKNAYQLMLLSVTQKFYQVYQSLGFGITKYGEDACFYLSQYNLAGGKVAKVRAAINHASKAGIEVFEYIPSLQRDHTIEKQMEELTSEWFKEKGGYKMHFMLSTAPLTELLDKRCFYAADNAGRILGLVVFLPYTNGYLADITRRRKDAPQGVLEKIMFEGFMKFKEEGILWGNMGLSPLYNVANSEKIKLTEKLFSYIYENLNSSYGFQQLHHAKEKYAPTHWEPRYLAYFPGSFSPKYAYALVRCQIKEGFFKVLKDEFLSFVKKIISPHKW